MKFATSMVFALAATGKLKSGRCPVKRTSRKYDAAVGREIIILHRLCYPLEITSDPLKSSVSLLQAQMVELTAQLLLNERVAEVAPVAQLDRASAF
jgi:hypothetical protein